MDIPATEQRNDRTEDLDLLSSIDLVSVLVEEQLVGAQVVKSVVQKTAEVVDLVSAALEHGGRLIYLGAGTPGQLASADKTEITLTFGLAQDRIIVVQPDESEDEDAVDHVEATLDRLALGAIDIVIGIAASGTTPWVLQGLQHANRVGSVTIGVVNNSDTVIGDEVDHAVVMETGAEPICGSTRMKAGLAQKLFLTTFSTAIMVRMGFTYGNLMTRAGGEIEKIGRRRVRQVVMATSLESDAAEHLLASVNGSVEAAILCQKLGIPAAESFEVLRASGTLRRAISGVH